MKRLTYILLFILGVNHLNAQDINEIQREFQQDTARIENHIRNGDISSTADFLQSIKYLEVEYDKLLNKYYHLLMSCLDQEGKQALKSAQINWIKFQTAD
ncbi:MAG: hypothetical protein Q4A54_09520, partial [Parabacteroides sp.]|nr:hypothetical protein [Parabacteroides sp.]